ncbi:hypothetical protein F0562_013026 [Nyssa sinensis]|uniref:Uncharacterized protein n=1 Tax=Nyssa sinensis TaxID=561372 RepID=A0A5J4ZUW1_9ASTE|nr:hypothetical protein F0562_013026 [Nyssa sinensis]
MLRGISFTKLESDWLRQWDLLAYSTDGNVRIGKFLLLSNRAVAEVGFCNLLVRETLTAHFIDGSVRRIKYILQHQSGDVMKDALLSSCCGKKEVGFYFQSFLILREGNSVSMEKLVKPYDKEYMKMAMLKHEETFKQQVHELHRIDDHDHGAQQKPRQTLDLEQPADEYIAESDHGDGMLEIEDESEIELTLGPTSYCQRKKGETTPLTSDSGMSFSSSSSGSSRLKRTSLGTQQRTDKTREELTGHKWGLPEANAAFQTGRRNSFDVEEQLRQDRLKQPSWLFQALSLNMT